MKHHCSISVSILGFMLAMQGMKSLNQPMWRLEIDVQNPVNCVALESKSLLETASDVVHGPFKLTLAWTSQAIPSYSNSYPVYSDPIISRG